MDCSYDLIYNVLAPKGTDPAVTKALCSASRGVVEENPEFAEAILTVYGEKPYFLNSTEAADCLKEESDMYMAYAELLRSLYDGIQKTCGRQASEKMYFSPIRKVMEQVAQVKAAGHPGISLSAGGT